MAIRPNSMTPEDFAAHRAEGKALAERHAQYDADPRAALYELEARVAKLEAAGKAKIKAAK